VGFVNVVEDPLLNALEIVSAGSQPGVLGTDRVSVDFGQVIVGSSATADVTLSNLGTDPGDPSITVMAIDISGGTYGTDFTGPIVLAPSGSTTVTVTFTPTNTSAQNETLTFTHTGSNTPMPISLSGAGASSIPIGFTSSALVGDSSTAPTSMGWGPDGRLYVSQQSGAIYAYTIARDGAPAGSGT
jgi:hypothetical protein